jgi:hypothetical protein
MSDEYKNHDWIYVMLIGVATFVIIAIAYMSR